MTVEHSTLTGASLHEPKGVAAAVANRVYVSNGSGSGSWTTVPLAAISGLATSFQSQLLHVRDQTANNTASSVNSTPAAWSGAFLALPLNTVITNEISGASLSSSQITLPAGTFYIDSISNYSMSAGLARQVRLRDITAGTTLVAGSIMTSANSASHCLTGRFTLSAPHVLEYQLHSGGNAVGVTAFNSGENQVWSDIKIWQVA